MAQRKLHDQYFKMAKAEGYVARSAYKLKEIHERFNLIRPGARVLDLGCAPGAWVQVALETVGPRGVVVGIDLKEVRENFGPNASVVRGDIYKTPAETLTSLAGGLFDVVVSDMAPDTTGHGDHFLSVRLCRRVLEMLPGLLKPGGGLAMKVFEGEEYPELVRETSASFSSARGFKPKSSREVSVEMYVVGLNFVPPKPKPESKPDAAAPGDTAPGETKAVKTPRPSATRRASKPGG
jgi:23S rRNA (uridine2552-2'-O)-methyltransferase